MTTTSPHAPCVNQTDGKTCGHPQDEHSRLSGCLHFVGAHACPCPAFIPNGGLPVTPYDSGTSSGHSGTSTSHARALAEDANGTTKGRQEWVVAALEASQRLGLTVFDVRLRTGWHHGAASAALSNLHQAGKIVRLTEVRDKCKVYVLPEFVENREVEPHGQRSTKPRTPKQRGPITLTPAEADALRRMSSRAASEQGPALTVNRQDLELVTEALIARVREPKA